MKLIILAIINENPGATKDSLKIARHLVILWGPPHFLECFHINNKNEIIHKIKNVTIKLIRESNGGGIIKPPSPVNGSGFAKYSDNMLSAIGVKRTERSLITKSIYLII